MVPSPFPPPPRKLDIIERDVDVDVFNNGWTGVDLYVIGVAVVEILNIVGWNPGEKEVAEGMILYDNVNKRIAVCHTATNLLVFFPLLMLL